jgi:hypothetical protein
MTAGTRRLAWGWNTPGSWPDSNTFKRKKKTMNKWLLKLSLEQLGDGRDYSWYQEAGVNRQQRLEWKI